VKLNPEVLRGLWQDFRLSQGEPSVDRVLCDPELRDQFLLLAGRAWPEADEKTILTALVGMRKKGKQKGGV
jgi:hypothetical protein